MPPELHNVSQAMIDKFALYRFIAPFRSRLQLRLRQQRLNVDLAAFAQALQLSEKHIYIAEALWEKLREDALVADFRPDPDDDMARIYAMGVEEVMYDIIEPLLEKLGLSIDKFDLTDIDFKLIATPRDLAKFFVRVATMAVPMTPPHA
jgi:hypothetical protein